MHRKEITDSIKKAIISMPYPIEGWLFGSEARGDARPDSDIDLLLLVDSSVVSNQMENDIFEPLYQIELSSGICINPLILPKEQWGKTISPFYLNVINERVRI
ncbi:MAG: nucleotidyltransferase domain-containing protein [Bacteroidales bacterium]|nr:nucleotidyltransferase domain-containing protein [Bacteroidales bacterium]MDY6348503.1 nucleotidyltransferase domain-containing protein [Bacteroidales bacterium]